MELLQSARWYYNIDYSERADDNRTSDEKKESNISKGSYEGIAIAIA